MKVSEALVVLDGQLRARLYWCALALVAKVYHKEVFGPLMVKMGTE